MNRGTPRGQAWLPASRTLQASGTLRRRFDRVDAFRRNPSKIPPAAANSPACRTPPPPIRVRLLAGLAAVLPTVGPLVAAERGFPAVVACRYAEPGDRPDDPWRDAARRHDARIREDRDRRDRERGPGRPRIDVDFDTEWIRGENLPDWVGSPPADRLVVVGPLVTDEDGGEPAARLAAEAAVAGRLAELAGLPSADAVDPDDVPRAIRRAAVQTLTRTTGENSFAVHRGHLLVDASPDQIEHLRRGYLDRLGRRRAAWAAGAGGVCVVLFAGLWGMGRRKLRQA